VRRPTDATRRPTGERRPVALLCSAFATRRFVRALAHRRDTTADRGAAARRTAVLGVRGAALRPCAGRPTRHDGRRRNGGPSYCCARRSRCRASPVRWPTDATRRPTEERRPVVRLCRRSRRGASPVRRRTDATRGRQEAAARRAAARRFVRALADRRDTTADRGTAARRAAVPAFAARRFVRAPTDRCDARPTGSGGPSCGGAALRPCAGRPTRHDGRRRNGVPSYCCARRSRRGASPVRRRTGATSFRRSRSCGAISLCPVYVGRRRIPGKVIGTTPAQTAVVDPRRRRGAQPAIAGRARHRGEESQPSPVRRRFATERAVIGAASLAAPKKPTRGLERPAQLSARSTAARKASRLLSAVDQRRSER